MIEIHVCITRSGFIVSHGMEVWSYREFDSVVPRIWTESAYVCIVCSV